MRLASRVAVLERSRPRGAACAACGGAPGQPLTLRCPPPRLFGEPAEPGPDACPACGRVLVLRVPPPRALREQAP